MIIRQCPVPTTVAEDPMAGHFTEHHAQAPPTDFFADRIAEANHRIANNLEALALTVRNQIQAKRTGSPLIPRKDAVELLTETAARITAIARLHRSLSLQP